MLRQHKLLRQQQIVASAQIDREDVVEEEENDEDEDDRVSPRRNREKGPSSTITEGSVCEAYKKRECPHGLTGKRLINGRACPNLHPRRCFRWCKHGENQRIGCTKGKDCPYFHPKLCRNSVLKRFCPNKECKFHHLKHTRRPREVLINRNQDNNPKPEPVKAEKLPPGPNSRLRYDSTSTLNASPTHLLSEEEMKQLARLRTLRQTSQPGAKLIDQTLF